MSNSFIRVGEIPAALEVQIDLDDAEHLRDIGRSILLSVATTKTIDDDSMVGICIIPNNFNIPGYYDPAVDAACLMVEDASAGDTWQTSVTYTNYRDTNDGGVTGIITELGVEVVDDRVVSARRSIYRDREWIEATGGRHSLRIERLGKRVMADTALQASHIAQLRERVDRRLRRAESTQRYAI